MAALRQIKMMVKPLRVAVLDRTSGRKLEHQVICMPGALDTLPLVHAVARLPFRQKWRGFEPSKANEFVMNLCQYAKFRI
jgi:hypothetical protein